MGGRCDGSLAKAHVDIDFYLSDHFRIVSSAMSDLLCICEWMVFLRSAGHNSFCAYTF
jgi:hypothetical protein